VTRAKPVPHPFVADPLTPGDPVTGDPVCRCGLVVKPGDGRHLMPDPIEDVRSRAAGEGNLT
jgi:hypothetical protein